MILNDIYEKYRVGDSLTDEELGYALDQLNKVNDILNELGNKDYILVQRDIYRIIRNLSDFSYYRKNK